MMDTPVNEADKFLVFTLDDRRYALQLHSVDRVLRAVEVTPLPDAPDIVLGIINMQGRIIPAIDLRRRFLLAERELLPSDHLIISSTPSRTYALVVDEVHSVVESSGASVVHGTNIFPHIGPLEGVMILDDDMILISDVDKLLSLEVEELYHRLSDPVDIAVTDDEELREQGNDL